MNWRKNLNLTGLNDARERVDRIEDARNRVKRDELADRINVALTFKDGGVSFDADDLRIIVSALRGVE